MTNTLANLKDRIARKRKLLRKGVWVRLIGWQIHWPNQDAQIEAIYQVRGQAKLTKPILGRRVWSLDDLTQSF